MMKKRRSNCVRGFNTCELILICGFIALFAMSAVPQFGDSWILSQVAGVKRDLSDVARAMESYRLENGAYPAAYMDSRIQPMVTRSECDHRLLTTPVAYITRMNSDPFAVPIVLDPSPAFALALNNYRLYAVAYRPSATFPYYYRTYTIYPRTAWMAFSFGPDQLQNTDGYRPLPRIIQNEAAPYYLRGIGKDKHGYWIEASGSYFGMRYDPTNGTLSYGDVYRFANESLNRIN